MFVFIGFFDGGIDYFKYGWSDINIDIIVFNKWDNWIFRNVEFVVLQGDFFIFYWNNYFVFYLFFF